MVGRYSQRQVRSQFNPLGFEDYAAVPMAAQKLEDSTIASAIEMQDQIDALPWHSEVAKKAKSGLDERIQGLTNKIAESPRGIYDIKPSQEIANIKNYKDTEFLPVQQQVQSAIAARKSLQEELSKNEKNPRRAQEILALFDKESMQSAQTGNINYSGRLLAPEVNIPDKIATELRKIPARTIEEDTGWRRNDEDGTWENVKTKQKRNFNETPKELINYGMQYIQQDPEVISYLQDEYMLQTGLGRLDSNEISLGDFMNVRLGEAAQTAAQGSVISDFSQTQQMKNQSDYQTAKLEVIEAYNNPIFREAGYLENFMYDEKTIEVALDPTKVIQSKIIDPNTGKELSAEEVSSKMETILETIQTRFKNQGFNIKNYTPEEINKASKVLYDYYRSKQFISDDFEGSPQAVGTIDRLKTIFKGSSGFFSAENFNEDDLINMLDMQFNQNFELKSLTKEESQALRQEANKALETSMERYNSSLSSLPEDLRKQYEVKTVDQFKSVLKQEYQNKANIPLTTVDYNIPSTDLVAQEVEKGNLQSLKGKSIILKKGSKIVARGSDDESHKQIQLVLAKEPKVTKGRRLLSGEYTGGRLFEIKDNTGETYTLITEPLNIKERQMYEPDKAVTMQFQDPTFEGSGEPIFTEAIAPGRFFRYTPQRTWKNGKLVDAIAVNVFEGETQVDNGTEYLEIHEFFKLREAQRAKELAEMYPSKGSQNKTSSGL